MTEVVRAGFSDNLAHENNVHDVKAGATLNHIQTSAGVEHVDVVLWVNYTWDVLLAGLCAKMCLFQAFGWLVAFDDTTSDGASPTAASCNSWSSCSTTGFKECATITPPAGCSEPIGLTGRINIPLGTFGEEEFQVNSHIYHRYDTNGDLVWSDSETATDSESRIGSVSAGTVAPPDDIRIPYFHV